MNPDHAVTAPDPRDRCPACGRSSLARLSFAEAAALYGYAKITCLQCRLTDVPRPPAHG